MVVLYFNWLIIIEKIRIRKLLIVARSGALALLSLFGSHLHRQSGYITQARFLRLLLSSLCLLLYPQFSVSLPPPRSPIAIPARCSRRGILFTKFPIAVSVCETRVVGRATVLFVPAESKNGYASNAGQKSSHPPAGNNNIFF